MPAAPSGPPSGSTIYVIDSLRQGGDQMLAFYRQSARFAIDAAGMWADTWTGLVPGAQLPAASVTDALGRLAEATFDLTDGALAIQRELVADAVGRLAPKP